MISLFTVLTLTACSSCIEPTPTPTPTPVLDASLIDTSIKDTVITGSSWEVILPIGWEERKTTVANVDFIAVQTTTKMLFMVTKESYINSLDQFTIESFRYLRGEGAQLEQTSSKNINDVKYIMAESVKDNIRMFVWLTVKNGFGYTISCGGPEGNSENMTACQNIILNFRLQ